MTVRHVSVPQAGLIIPKSGNKFSAGTCTSKIQANDDAVSQAASHLHSGSRHDIGVLESENSEMHTMKANQARYHVGGDIPREDSGPPSGQEVQNGLGR